MKGHSDVRKSTRALSGAFTIVVLLLLLALSSGGFEVRVGTLQLFNKNEELSNVEDGYGLYDMVADGSNAGYKVGYKFGAEGTSISKGSARDSDSKANFQPATLFQEVMAASPVVLFIRSSEASSMELKNFLSSEYSFSPEMAVVDLDKHEHGKEVEDYIGSNKLNQRRVGTSNSHQLLRAPYMFINGVSVINNSVEENIKTPHVEGTLIETFTKLTSNKVLVSEVQTPSNS